MYNYCKYRRPAKMNDYGLKRVPDYTELAYKEAVSKLRYFLSGNYAPSVRSYGGSASIKNLDESDGDLDKKYSPYNALAEYKPRPRLTAKYTTLYADSLKNYAPEPVKDVPTPAPAPVGDVTGGTNPDVINFIQKQEEYIEQLERESQYCRDELNNLLGKVKEVISENEHLHDAQKNKLITRMFHSYNGSETDELDDAADSTGVDSDNKVSPSKPRRGAKSRSTKLEGPNIVFESRIAELEAQLTQAKIDLKKVQDENNENKRKLASGLVDSTCLDGFKRQVDNLQRDKSSLEAQISKLKLNLEQQDSDNGKYKRSEVLETQLREERNNLEAEVRRLKDDLAKERSKVRELAGEGARRAIQERSAAEQRYNAHFDELQHDLAAQYDNVSKLQFKGRTFGSTAKTVAELEAMIQSQNSLMEKLTGECRLLTDKLDDANRRHKAEKTQLLCRNAELMRKLRHLWCTHKKYCTTTVARSLTPLSGYAHSRSSYDIDRTYYTSTPYTNRFKNRYEVGNLTRNLSDLSIDRIDSDDDPAKHLPRTLPQPTEMYTTNPMPDGTIPELSPPATPHSPEIQTDRTESSETSNISEITTKFKNL
ncbi:hypothetical protein O3G_MSEX014201 [Manduca sexta]|uniref:Serologically defined colon cancer antigen 8 homolog n=1 Tax=Manduca sexta TaxID=7130 RepID=A0A921ZV38_MANSE|nr:hypothetical protein O3G_MSEX014201 [Manduca sexta]KAG6463991.1 hypothetical protein O3G_MSEX014201 [Manduca sexta]